MNVIEEFQTLRREVHQLRHSANRSLAEKKIRELLELMRQRNAAFKKEMEQLHEAARLVTSQSNTATLAQQSGKNSPRIFQQV